MPLTAFEIVTLAIAVVTAGVYGYVGSRLERRRIEGEAALAWRLFIQWWYGLAAVTFAGAIFTLARGANIVDEAFALTYLYLVLLLITYILWCLLYYLLYLLTGKRSILAPITGFYIVFYVYMLYAITAAGPYLTAEGIKYREPLGGPVLALLVAGLLGPHLIGAVGYLRLFFKVEELTQRYRIGLISGTILLWFGSSLLGNIPVGDQRLAAQWWWILVTRGIALVAAFAFLLAYRPPRWVRDRYGIEAVDETTPPAWR